VSYVRWREGNGMSGQPRVIPGTIFERHFSPRTLSELWGFSEDTIQRWFEDAPGVLRQGESGDVKRRRRRKMFLRIPESVAMKIYREKTQV
jgi:hypothetical protein